VLSATKDRILPTTVTGSGPRPTWFTGNPLERPFSTAMADVAYREQFVDAVGALAQGANVVRGELGAERTYVRAADPGLQVDVLDQAPEPVSA
jgi:hypothetical protein